MNRRIEVDAVVSTGDGLALRRYGVADRPIAGASLFTVGVTIPVEANTGAGISGPMPTVEINGNVSITDGQVLKDRIINGWVTITGTGRIENCIVRGPATDTTASRSLINTSGASVSGLGTPNVSFTTIDPQTPSAYWSGVGNKNYYAYRVKILRCVDGFSAFSNTVDGLCNVKIRGCYVSNLSQFRPDYANGNRPVVHGDALVQCQGNLGPPEDILLEGNSANARPDPTVGTQPTEYTELSCVMVSPNTQTRVSYKSVKNTYRGGVYTVNAGASNPGGAVVHDGDRFELPGGANKPTAALVIDSATARTVTACTYIETGEPVPVTNG